MIQIGVYGVGWRRSARRKTSFGMAGDSLTPSQVPIEEPADRLRVAWIEVEVVVAEARKVHALDRTSPHAREALRMMRRDQAVGLAHEDEQRHAKARRMRRRIERMAQQERDRKPWIHFLADVERAREGRGEHDALHRARRGELHR